MNRTGSDGRAMAAHGGCGNQGTSRRPSSMWWQGRAMQCPCSSLTRINRVCGIRSLTLRSRLRITASALAHFYVARRLLGAVEIEQRLGHIVDGVFLVAAILVGALQRGQHGRKLKVNQLVDHGEFHVLKHRVKRKMVIGGVEDMDDGGL